MSLIFARRRTKNIEIDSMPLEMGYSIANWFAGRLKFQLSIQLFTHFFQASPVSIYL